MKLFNLRILLVLSFLVAFGSVGAVWAEPASETPAVNLTTEQWTGHSFTFLALPADRQAAGYEIFPVDKANKGFTGDRSVRIPYAQHAGKKVTVTEVIPYPAGPNLQEYMVYMKVDETGEKLVGRTMRGQLEGLVLTADLTNARQQFLGKTIYPKFRELAGLYTPGSEEIPKSVTTSIGGAATVVDVYAGNQSDEPIWLVVSVNGEKAILPIAYSWTNIPASSWTETAPWQEALFTEDPRPSLGWSHTLWYQIENGNVEEGMTKAQVLLSWGKPVHKIEDGAAWIYDNKKLNFNGDILQSIELLTDGATQ
ncbi:MAG TPA: hypothetical protein DCP36_17245 [Sporomusaceae bacterium]|uniref:hypothetical protein n=1 Tax=Anaerospora sp. TaxID=1960278 RepID=UPI000ED6F421|nr:hypothetical protein [Anaerospora sp.]HAK74850.1 hypothetical protein [Sporomusaceae bacterium]